MSLPVRNTKQRQIILDIVQNSCDHPSCEQIYRRALTFMPNISLGTVYRNLNQLVLSKQIRQVSVAGAADRYDCKTHTHHHFICSQCGEIHDINDLGISDSLNGLSKDGYSISHLNLSVYGICPKCMEANAKKLNK